MNNLNEINCREIFQNAYEKRYTWDGDFKGYRGKCIFLIDNETHEGKFSLGKDFKPEIEDISDDKVIKSIASQLFEVFKPEVFNWYSNLCKTESLSNSFLSITSGKVVIELDHVSFFALGKRIFL